MADPYEVDDEGNPVAEEGSAAEEVPGETEPPVMDAAATDPAAQAALQRQVAQTLRFMRVQTAVGFVILLILIVVLADIRGLMIIVTIVFLLTSVVAYSFLSRTLHKRVLGGGPPPRT